MTISGTESEIVMVKKSIELRGIVVTVYQMHLIPITVPITVTVY